MQRLVENWLPVFVLCGLIFAASGDTLSFPRSSRIIEPLARWLVPGLSDGEIHAIVVAVRKCGHVAEYGLLTAMVWRALCRGTGKTLKDWSWRRAGLALIIVIAYAATDELHQAFVPSREGSPYDVGIDALGGFLVLGSMWGLSLFPCKKGLEVSRTS